MLAKNDKEIDQAYKRLLEISTDDKQRMVYEARELWLMDQRTREAEALDKGIAEGIEQGLEQGLDKGRAEGIADNQRKTALRALKAGLPIETIIEITDLSEDEIKNLIEP